MDLISLLIRKAYRDFVLICRQKISFYSLITLQWQRVNNKSQTGNNTIYFPRGPYNPFDTILTSRVGMKWKTIATTMAAVLQRQYNAKTSNPLTSKRLSAIKACCRLLEINWIFSLKKLVVASQTNLIFSLLPIVDGCRQSYREIWKWMISFYVQVENIVRCKITVVLCFQKPNTSILHLQNPQIQFSFYVF